MTQVTLAGTSGQRAVNIGHLHEVPEQDTDGKAYHRRAAFARMKALDEHLKDARTPHGHAWNYIKAQYGVQSRSELTAEQWAIISARLDACKKDYQLCQQFIEQVKAFNAPKGKTMSEPFDNICFVLRKNADASDTLVYLGEHSQEIVERSQAHADATGRPCILHFQGAKTTFTPITVTEPEPQPQPQIQGLGWHSHINDGGFFFVDKQAGQHYTTERKGKDEVVAWLNFNGQFTLNVVSDKFSCPEVPAGLDLESAVNWVYANAEWNRKLNNANS